MKYNHKVSDDFLAFLEAIRAQPAPPEGISLHDIFRAGLAQMGTQNKVSSTNKVSVEDKYFTNSDGEKTRLRVYTPLSGRESKPLLYWIHGGGTMSGVPEQEDSTLYELALDLDCVVTSVDYRLAPENPFPKPLNDCYEGLEYVVKRAADFGINSDKIAVGGGSAGGLLSTSVAIRARDENGPKIRLQVLEYPMADSRHNTDSHKEITDIGIWDSGMNQYAYQCYLQDVPESDYPKAVPMLNKDLSNLPKAFLATGTMDCLRDETIAYAERLAEAGVQVELHVYPGMVHAFDLFAPQIQDSQDLWKVRSAAIKRAFETD